MDRAELMEIIEKHSKWLSGEGGKCADLGGANLRGANLGGANLRGASLSHADLSYADLIGDNLRDADLSYANLRGANLRGANLRSANLRGADLGGADLGGANLNGADLNGASLNDTKSNKYTSGYHLSCPEAGSFTAYKKASGVVVTLLIPEDAKRSSATSRKCRADKAFVLEIDNELEEVASDHDRLFVYRKGSTVSVDDFDENRWNECAPGIHFFITRKEAEDY